MNVNIKRLDNGAIEEYKNVTFISAVELMQEVEIRCTGYNLYRIPFDNVAEIVIDPQG